MKFTTTIDTDHDSPNVIGEFLRGRFFDEKIKRSSLIGEYRETGCYSTFELRPDVKPLPDLVIGTELPWTRAMSPEGIEMRYSWDGDGVLAFFIPNGPVICSADCKKDDEWESLTRAEWAKQWEVPA